MQYSSEILIPRRADLVWEVLTEPRHWARWWGGELVRLEPRWTAGALMHWGMGGPSEILEITPVSSLAFLSGSTTLLHLEAEGDTTLVRLINDFSSSRLRVTDHGLVQAEVTGRLTLLQSLAEARIGFFRRRSKPRDPATLAGAPADVDQLLRDLAAALPRVRRAAAIELGRRGDPRSAAGLVGALTFWDEEVREAAAAALAELGWQPGDDREQALIWIAEESWDAFEKLEADRAARLLIELCPLTSTLEKGRNRLKRIGEGARPALLEALAGDNPEEAELAAEVLGESADRSVIESLHRVLQGPAEDRVVVATIAALARLGATEASGSIAERLAADQSVEVREAAAEALARVGTPESVEGLLSMASEAESDRVRMALLKLVLSLASPDQLEETVELLEEELPLWSYEALARREDGAGVDLLEALPEDRVRWSWVVNELIEVRSRHLLRVVGRAGPTSYTSEREQLFEALAEMTSTFAAELERGGDEEEQLETLGYLGEIGTDPAIEAIVSALDSPSDSLRIGAVQALEVAGTRHEGLNVPGNPEAKEVLVGLLEKLEPSDPLRTKVQMSLKQIRLDEAKERQSGPGPKLPK